MKQTYIIKQTHTMKKLPSLKTFERCQHNQKFVTQRLSEVNFDWAKQTVEELDELSKSSLEIWMSLCNYGFWFLTNTFSESRI